MHPMCPTRLFWLLISFKHVISLVEKSSEFPLSLSERLQRSNGSGGKPDEDCGSRLEVISKKWSGRQSKTFRLLPSTNPSLSSPVVQITFDSNHNRTMTSRNGEKLASRWAFRINNLGRQVQHGFISTFLPEGYPAQTPPGYLSYSAWSWAQDLSTHLRSVLSTQRILEGMGVGRSGASALSASLNFVARDGAGMVASLLFTSVASSRFRGDVKRWRLFADIANDVGITVGMLALAVPKSMFLPMLCIGNIWTAMCGVAAGSCGGSINLHWSKGSDISDINAKFGAQHTVTGGLGLVFAAMFARSVASVSKAVLWTLYSALTFLHIYANVQCMKLIAFNTFNNARMNIIACTFFDAWWEDQPMLCEGCNDLGLMNAARRQSGERNRFPTLETSCVGASLVPEKQSAVEERSRIATLAKKGTNTSEELEGRNRNVRIMTPVEVSNVEPLFFSPFRQKHSQPPLPIRIGISFDEFARLSRKSRKELEELVKNKEGHLIVLGHFRRFNLKNRQPIILVSIFSDADPTQISKAYFEALFLGYALKKKCGSLPATTKMSDDLFWKKMEEETFSIFRENCNTCWNAFQQSAESAGWSLSSTAITTEGYGIDILR